MSEFSIIERFCHKLGKQHNTTRLSVGDDAAIVSIPENMDMAVSVDSMVQGVHFYPDTEPALIAYKLMAVNLSDMAAMGAKPRYATLALSINSLDEQWLSEFFKSLDKTANHYGVQLIGGDTTHGEMNLSLTIMGLLPKGKALSRADARAGEDVYISNTIGDAALAVACIDKRIKKKSLNIETLKQSLDKPVPQVELGQRLLNIAESCIDLSDGLVADAGHIAKQSAVDIEIDVNKLPISEQYQHYLQTGGNMDIALTGGDDYQLLFTAVPERRGEINKLAEDLSISITKIGKVMKMNNESGSVVLIKDDAVYELNSSTGYQHFS